MIIYNVIFYKTKTVLKYCLKYQLVCKFFDGLLGLLIDFSWFIFCVQSYVISNVPRLIRTFARYTRFSAFVFTPIRATCSYVTHSSTSLVEFISEIFRLSFAYFCERKQYIRCFVKPAEYTKPRSMRNSSRYSLVNFALINDYVIVFHSSTSACLHTLSRLQ